MASSSSPINVNCTRGDSLAVVAANALPNTVVNIKGACAGPITITANGLQLNAVGAASINGGGKNAVTITGAQRVGLTGLTITGGATGIVAQNGAQVLLQNDTVSGNAQTGISILANSSVTVTGGSSQNNGLFGIDVEATSALVVTGSYSITGNAVFGIDVNNGSSLTLTAANLTVSQNTLGIQLGTNASGFLDGQSILIANQNFSDGITIVSGSHVVDFGGTIQTSLASTGSVASLLNREPCAKGAACFWTPSVRLPASVLPRRHLSDKLQAFDLSHYFALVRSFRQNNQYNRLKQLWTLKSYPPLVPLFFFFLGSSCIC